MSLLLEAATVYRSDTAHVIAGDARHFLPELPANSADLLATDPPYGVGWQSNHRNTAFRTIEGDTDAGFVDDVINESLRVLRPSRHVYVFGPTDLSRLPVGGLTELIWNKEQLGMGDLSLPWAPAHERIAFGVYYPNRAAREKKGRGKLSARMRRGSVLSVPRRNAMAVTRHPTEKPVLVMRQIIESSSCHGDTILDPFAGSGSTGVAAIIEGRKALLIEKEPDYARLAAERIRTAETLVKGIDKL